MRVHELAKEVGLTSKEVIKRLNSIGVGVSSNMNSVSDKDAESLKKSLKTGDTRNETKVVKVVRRAADEDRGGASGRNEKKPGAVKAAEDHARKVIDKAENVQKKGGKSVKEKAAEKGAENSGSGDSAAAAAKTDSVKRQDAPVQKKQNQGKNRAQQGGRGRDADQNRGKGTSQKSSSDRRDQNRAGSGNADSGNSGDRGRRNQNSRRNENRRNDHQKKSGEGRQNVRDISRPNKHSHTKDQRKEQRREAARQAEQEAMAIPAGAIIVTVPITVKGFSEQVEVSVSEIIMKLMKMGIMANVNENLDEDTVMILGDEFGKQIVIGNIEEEAEEEGIEDFEDREEDLRDRPPVITVMGHVDHGKTSLLDKIRKTDVTASESGGITQHIGASEIVYEGQRIVFLDTPGHEAFTAMRARGAYVTDIAVLVVAADDSVMPQTIEAISHAKAAGVPVIVAINKIDKPGANVERVKQDLAQNGILVEDWGGTVICVPVSAKTGEGIDALLEMILLQAEMLELKANPNRLALGSVIEARLDKQRGPIATLLIQNGTLQSGMSIVAGNCYGRIKLMTNYKGAALKKAGPATAVEILGLDDVPEAGDTFNAVKTDKVAREIAENRKEKQREQVLQKTAGVSLEDLFSQISQGEVKELNLIIKADVQGSVGALVASLEKLKNDECAVKIIHTGVGTVNESDVMLAGTSGAVIIGFNVRPGAAVVSMAQRENVEIRTYSVIYEVIEEVEAALKGMLSPEFKEEVLGSAEVRSTFKVPNVGVVAGAYVVEGKVERNAQIRLVRDGIVIHEGTISSLKRFKDDAKEVAKGYECGIGIENYNDIKDGDIMEAFKMVEVERQ